MKIYDDQGRQVISRIIADYGLVDSYDTGWVACSSWTDQHLGSTVGGDVVHNLDTPLRNLLVKVFISSDGTDNNSFEAGSALWDVVASATQAYGIHYNAIDDDNIIIQTGSHGFYTFSSAGVVSYITTQSYYYRIIVYKMNTVYSGVTLDYYETPWINRSLWQNKHLGSDTTKNADSNVTHNLNAPLSDLLVKILISEDGTDDNSFELTSINHEVNIGGGETQGITIHQVNNDSITLQTGQHGILYLIGNGTASAIDAEDWYYKIKIYKLTAVPSANIFDLLRDADNDTKITVEQSADEDIIRMSTAGTDRITILNDGKVGIGINSPDGLLQVDGGPQWSSFNLGANIIISGAKNNALGFLDTNGLNPWAIYDDASGYLHFVTMPALGNTVDPPVTRMIIDSSGKVGIGTDSPSQKLHVVDNVADGYVCFLRNDGNAANRHGLLFWCGADDGSGTTNFITAAVGDGDPITGTINTQAGVFQLTDLSDEKLKQDIKDVTFNGLDTISQIKVRNFKFKKIPEVEHVGFIGQELQQIIPEAVSIIDTKKGTLGSSKAALIPYLVKAVQELKTENDTLKTENDTLKTAVESLTVRIEALEEAIHE